MGALDTYAGTARCPRCGDVLHLAGQTKFFVPDFFGHFHRHFVPGVQQPLDFDPAALVRARVWDGEWWRVREPGDPAALSLLADIDDLRGCLCGACLAIVFHFALQSTGGESGTATLTSIALLDALADDVASAVDFTSGENIVPWNGDFRAFEAGLEALAAAPFSERAARLRAALHGWFTPPEKDETNDTAAQITDGWTAVTGPMRCENCGTERERNFCMVLTHPVFDETILGPGWRGGELVPGTRIEGDFGWMSEDADRGGFLRLRHPLTPGRLTLMGSLENWGCPCEAGRACVVLRFAVDRGGATLESIHLRAVRRREDLEGVDFVEAPQYSRAPLREERKGWRPGSREEALKALLSQWRVPE